MATIAACAGSDETPQAVAADGAGVNVSQELIKAAQAEGTLTLYLSPGEETGREWASAFTDEYGIEVVLLRQGSNELMERFSTEARAGQNLADVLWKSDPGDFATLQDEGLLAQYTPATDASYSGGTSHGYYYPTYSLTYVFAYNPKELSDDELKQVETEGAKAFADPKFKGRIAVSNINVSESVTATYYDMAERLKDTYGYEWLEAVAANEPTSYDSSAPMADRLIAGEFAMAFPFPDSFLGPMVENGAPVRWFYPEETPTSTSYMAIAAGAPHPNAARLFMEWATTAEANQEMARIFQASPNHADARNVRTVAEQPWYKEPAKTWDDWPSEPNFNAGKEAFIARVGDIFGYRN